MKPGIIEKLNEAVGFVRRRTQVVPRVGLILGSGLGNIMEHSADDVVFEYNEIPHFAESTVEGHKGKLAIGSLSGVTVAVMQGRLHYYEGYSMEEVIFPVRLMRLLGIEYLIITAAAGGINPDYRAGDIVFLKDHINFMGDNCLRGPHFSAFGERFPDMGEVYSKDLRKKGIALARKNRIRVSEGVYAAVSGPSYETSAEVKALRKLGGDLAGMSVVPEAVCARQMGTKVIGIAYVANKAGGHNNISHKEVLNTGAIVSRKIGKIICSVIENIKGAKHGQSN